jgi:hypothetical protein
MTSTSRNHSRPTITPLPRWRDLYPNGRILYYEGDDPEGSAATIKAEFGFDVTQGGEFHHIDEHGHDHGYWWAWTEEAGFSFECPPEHLDAIDSDRFPVGT